MRTLIRNGTVVNTDATTRADVMVDGEKIALIGSDLPANADRTLDASDKWVIPGAIDVHTHMELPFGGTFAKDTFETGTRVRQPLAVLSDGPRCHGLPANVEPSGARLSPA